MKLIVLSWPTNFDGEHRFVLQLLEAGMETFHLRKPNFSKVEYEDWLAQIPAKFYKRVVVHHHHDLVNTYGLKGVHFTAYNREKLEKSAFKNVVLVLQDYGFTVSSSLHQLSEVGAWGNLLNYVFISPVFDSLSKRGYKGKPSLRVTSWKGKVKAQLIALGGIQADRLVEVQEKGFQGAAVLGTIWEKPEKSLDQFQRIRELCQQIGL